MPKTDTPALARWIEQLPLDDLKPAPRNPKGHDDGRIDSSIDAFGYVEPIVMDERTGCLVAGHGRLDSLKRRRDAGDTPPEGVNLAVDGAWLIPIVRGWSSANDDEAFAYLVASNSIGEAGGWQRRSLAEWLTDLDERATSLRRIAWDDEGYDQLVVDEGVKAEREAEFLDSFGSAGPDGGAEGRGSARPRQGSDVVDLRLPMADRERDEAIALLRQHQRALSDAGRGDQARTLSATALEVLRTWAP